nr:hypothetical protein [Tanacetum cinerariifolium]GEV62196.1 hypothetical protein [Tanacetum cinerariifolium]
MTFEEVEAKFNTVWKQMEDFIPMGSKEEAERIKRKGINLEQESAKKQKSSEEITEEAKSPKEVTEKKVKEMMHLVLVEEVYVEALQVKHHIIDWKHLDREDLNQLWRLVKETLKNRPPSIEWKLYYSCEVHHVAAKDKEIFMLLENDYPLRKGLALVMICYKLQVENFSQMANESPKTQFRSVFAISQSFSFYHSLRLLRVNLDEAFTFGDQFLNEKPSKEEPGKANVETEVKSMVTVPIHQASLIVPPLSTPIIDLTPPKPVSPLAQEPIFTATIAITTTATTTLPLPPPPQQQSTTDPELDNCVSALEKICANFKKKNKLQDKTTQALPSRIYTLENHDLYSKIDKYINEMFESSSYRSHPEHTTLYEALETSMDGENMKSSMKIWLSLIRKSKLIKVDLEDQIDLLNPKCNRVMHDISKPLPLGGPPDFRLEDLVLSPWIESERDYDISAAYGILRWWFKRKEFYITRHNAPSNRSAVRSHMKDS